MFGNATGTECALRDYRTRIYERYATGFADAPRFDEASAERWGGPYDRYLRGWLPGRSDASILDLGCGGGRLLHFLKQRGYERVKGVDLSREQVTVARQVGVPVLMAGVLEYLEAHAASFDLLVGLDIIEHFDKEEVLRFLDACHAALRPGGRLVLQTPNAESPLCGQVRYGDFTHEVAFSPGSLGRLLRLCGFSRIEPREQGPVPRGPFSLVRFLLWRTMRLGLRLWNLAEVGWSGSGVCSRVFLVSATKGAEGTER